jgi:hypothetical protein
MTTPTITTIGVGELTTITIGSAVAEVLSIDYSGLKAEKVDRTTLGDTVTQTLYADWGQSTDDDEMYAVEATYNTKWVLNQSVVWLYPSISCDYYLFSYFPGVYRATLQYDIAPLGNNYAEVKLNDGTTTQQISVYSNSNCTIKVSDASNIMVAYGELGQWWIIGQDCCQPSSGGSSGGGS